MNKLSNEDLVKKLHEGDKSVFNHLFHLHYKTLCLYALRFTNSHVDAEEAIQHIFVQFWEKRKQLKKQVPIKALLYKSTQNHCLNRIKHLNVKTKYADDLKASNLEEDNKSYHDVEYLELLEHFEEALVGLPERCRMVFLLSREEQLSYKEIAKKMDISVKTVEAQMGKALKILRIKLSDYLIFMLLCIFL